MKRALFFSLMGLGAALALPAAAEPGPHQHQHGQAKEADAPARQADEDKPASGSEGMGAGMRHGGMMHGGRMGGMMQGGMKHCEHHGGADDDLQARIRQLEKRLDAMQMTLELLADRQGGTCAPHCERHGDRR